MEHSTFHMTTAVFSWQVMVDVIVIAPFNLTFYSFNLPPQHTNLLFFQMLDFISILLICTFKFVHHFLASLAKNLFVIDELVNERQMSLNRCFVLLSLYPQPLFSVFLHLLGLS